VPHTGTRTLMQVLGQTDFKHFMQNEGDFEGQDYHIDFPIRDPLDTCISWRCYQPDREDMDEFRRWEAAIEYLKDKEHTVHKIENLPVLEGKSGEHWAKDAIKNRDLESLKKLPEVRYLLEWYPRHAEFFKPHYPEGFWWHKRQETQSS